MDEVTVDGWSLLVDGWVRRQGGGNVLSPVGGLKYTHYRWRRNVVTSPVAVKLS